MVLELLTLPEMIVVNTSKEWFTIYFEDEFSFSKYFIQNAIVLIYRVPFSSSCKKITSLWSFLVQFEEIFCLSQIIGAPYSID